MPALRPVLRCFLVPLVLTGGLIVTTLRVAPSATAATRRQERIWDGLRVARAQIGDPYRYGAEGPNAFGCSGLVYYNARRAGFKHIPWTSSRPRRHMNR